MSLVTTHHSLVVNEVPSVFREEHLGDLTTKITFQLVQKNPRLIAEVEAGNISDEVLKTEIVQLVDEFNLCCDRDELIRNVMNYMFGYGILQALIEDDEVSDIDVPRYNYCIVKRQGVKEVVEISFVNEQDFERFCKLIIIRNGGVINENDAHARVSDSYYRLRINVTIPPRSVTGPSLCIRKHRQSPYSLDDLVRVGMMDGLTKDHLERIMASSSRFIICGKGASGKTTLLRALLERTDRMERILVCEKDMELHLEGVNFIVQRIKKSGSQFENSLKQLIADGLTMSLDGYCIGEIIGDEAWEFVKAGHTDHRVFGTIHANSPKDVIQRLLMLIEPVVALSESRLERLIFESMDYIIHLENFRVADICQLKVEGDGRWLQSIV
ncbi:MAG: CpaF family protein [Clostridia bacterium]|nr:CpaF family protein [Clostridia bacterium]